VRTTTARAAAVSTGTLILCLTGGGIAAASMVPTPSTPTAATSTVETLAPTTLASPPPPGDIVKLVEDTATTVIDTAKNVAGQPAKTPTSGTDQQPAAHPVLHLPSSHPAHARPAANPSTTSWSLPAGASLGDAAPALPIDWSAPSARTPVVAAGATGAAPTTHVQTDAVSTADPAGPGVDVMRGVLVALSAAAVATLAYGHVTLARTK